MYDELVKNLRHDSASALQNCEFDFVYDWMLQAADAIEELSKKLFYAELSEAHTLEIQKALLDSVKIPRWIPVEERLPEKDDDVLLCYEWTGRSGTIYREVGINSISEIVNNPIEVLRPLYWMPLPEPPKEEE